MHFGMGLDDFGCFHRVHFSGRPDGLRKRCGKAPRHDIGYFVALFKPDKFDDFGRLPSGIDALVRRIAKMRSCQRRLR